MADRYRLSPSRYLGLPWPEWGETDFWLTQGYAAYRRLVCPCGSGAWRADCLDDASSGHWQIEVEVHQSQVALVEFRELHKEEMPDGAYLHVLRLPDGEEPTDPLIFDPARAAAEFEAHQKRHNLE